ncbi:MAG TPA: 3-ketoacyl-ACP reductase FabG2 [Verrucomicrobiae bacterium]|nr:3-ketoacyl-ACP reductase FabG2 [Verrucomicrobiae bacterium]
MTADHPRSVLVTGASGGIGRATALALAAAGFDLALHYRSGKAAAESLQAEIESGGRRARLLAFDIADRAGTEAALEADIKAHGAYYGVVANAGVTRDGPFPAMSPGDWDSVLHTNLDGFYNVLRPLVMPMVRKRRGGRIVAVSSVSGVAGNRGQVNYSASKAGIIGAVQALALELASRQITVNAVAPGLIQTDMIKDVPLEEAVKAIPAGRVGTPEEVGALIAFLMSDAAGYITRQVISINGGMI